MFGELVRRVSFWSLDWLKGRKIRKHYIDIKKINEDENFRIHQHNKLLKDLLNHAANQTFFYKEYKGILNINDFPVVDKKVVIENYDQFEALNYKNKKKHLMSTSGSTGRPFTIIQDLNKRKRVQAELIYFGEKAGFKIGEQNAYLRIWNEKNQKSRLDLFMKNLIAIDNSNLNTDNLEYIRQILKNQKKLKCILGYAASLDLISKYLISKGDTPDMFGIKIIISGAEILKEETRNNLKKVFGCKVVSRYSNQENGILAQEATEQNFFMINHGSYYIEFLKNDSDEHAEIGELARVVVTDLFNYSMPLIRYDTGDLARIAYNDSHEIVIASIEGRKMDFIYATSGDIVSPHSISLNMRTFQNINQYQFIQETYNQYTLKIDGYKDTKRDLEIDHTLKKILGKDAQLYIMYVDEILITKSGKYRLIINNYK